MAFTNARAQKIFTLIILFKCVCSEFLVETFDSAAALNGLLLAGVERMTLRTNFYFQRVGLLGRTDLKLSATSTSYVHDFVFGLDIFLHFTPLYSADFIILIFL